ncbi:hypothetical protein BD770DRAFT_395705 [Pilaira anomala]|nr:hypothetical protein BD770DRAFT_395705 [Pilaira anomala]
MQTFQYYCVSFEACPIVGAIVGAVGDDFVTAIAYDNVTTLSYCWLLLLLSPIFIVINQSIERTEDWDSLI